MSRRRRRVGATTGTAHSMGRKVGPPPAPNGYRWGPGPNDVTPGYHDPVPSGSNTGRGEPPHQADGGKRRPPGPRTIVGKATAGVRGGKVRHVPGGIPQADVGHRGAPNPPSTSSTPPKQADGGKRNGRTSGTGGSLSGIHSGVSVGRHAAAAYGADVPVPFATAKRRLGRPG